jgi:hypothetical protein
VASDGGDEGHNDGPEFVGGEQGTGAVATGYGTCEC